MQTNYYIYYCSISFNDAAMTFLKWWYEANNIVFLKGLYMCDWRKEIKSTFELKSFAKKENIGNTCRVSYTLVKYLGYHHY